MKVIPEALNLISTFLLKCFQIIIVRIVNFYQRGMLRQVILCAMTKKIMLIQLHCVLEICRFYDLTVSNNTCTCIYKGVLFLIQIFNSY
jgi:hypothetical protein